MNVDRYVRSHSPLCLRRSSCSCAPSTYVFLLFVFDLYLTYLVGGSSLSSIQYTINSQADFDGIAVDHYYDRFSRVTKGILGDVIIGSNFSGSLDLGNFYFIDGTLSATDNGNFTGITGSNLTLFGTGLGGLHLQNLSSFNNLDLPALNSSEELFLSLLPELDHLSLPSFNFNDALDFDLDFTVNSTGISEFNGLENLSRMSSITITNNPNLTKVDFGSVTDLTYNLTVFNNGPGLALNFSGLSTASSIKLSNVDSINLGHFSLAEYGIELTNNTFITIDTGELQVLGLNGFLCRDNANLASLQMSSLWNDYDSQSSPIQIYNNPKLVITESSFGMLAYAGNITINATING